MMIFFSQLFDCSSCLVSFTCNHCFETKLGTVYNMCLKHFPIPTPIITVVISMNRTLEAGISLASNISHSHHMMLFQCIEL